MGTPSHSDILQRMVDAVEQVWRRLVRVCEEFRYARIDYAVVGGNAVAAWVKTIDPGGIRNTPDIDILIRREDRDAVKRVLGAAGFHYRHANGRDMFLDRPDASPRGAVHILFAGETVKPDQPVPNPDVSECVEMDAIRFATLDALVRTKLSSYRLKDRMHLVDLIEIGLLDRTWAGRLPSVLAARLQQLLDTPDG